MNAPDTPQRFLGSQCLSALMFVAVAGILAFTLARWPGVAGLSVAVIVLFLAIVRFRQLGFRVSFSLKTMLLVTGLIACGIKLAMMGGPWKEVHRFPRHAVNLAMSADGKLVAASQGTSIEICETQTGRSVQTIKMSAAEAKAQWNPLWTFEMGFTPDSKSLMTVGWQSYPCLFDVATGQELRRWPANQGMSALALLGSRLVTDSVTKPNTVSTCNVFDPELDQPILTVESYHRFFRTISPAGSHVLVGKNDDTQPYMPQNSGTLMNNGSSEQSPGQKFILACSSLSFQPMASCWLFPRRRDWPCGTWRNAARFLNGILQTSTAFDRWNGHPTAAGWRLVTLK